MQHVVVPVCKNSIKIMCIVSVYLSTKPLRMIMKEANHHSEGITPLTFNTDVIIDIISSCQKQTLEVKYFN